MHVITLAATKGGCSKTTLAASLSSWASLKSKVAIVDVDPQQSLARWHEIRVREAGNADKPTLVKHRHYDKAIEKARAEGFEFTIVDSPPGSIKHTVAAMAEADLVVIPCRPSPLDVEAISVMVELCQQHGHDFVFVLTGTTPRSAMTAGARDYLKRLGEVLEVEITHRQSYSSAMILGGAAPEKDATARAEIAGLWEAIVKRLRLSTKKKANRKGSLS